MDAISGFKILPDEFIDSLLLSKKITKVIKAANNLKQHGYTEDKKYYKVERDTLHKLMVALTMLKVQQPDDFGASTK